MQITDFPLQKVLRNTKILFFTVLAAYVSLTVALALDYDPMRQSIYQRLLDQIKDIAILIYDFAHPFVIVILIVLLLKWLMKKFDLNIKIPPLKEWNIFNLVLMMVLTSFVVSALGGIGGTPYLKDLSLVVIGFYCGIYQRKLVYKKTYENIGDLDAEDAVSNGKWTVFNIILTLVVASFVFSALCGLSGTDNLKDLSLVVVGFHFGTFQQKII